MNLRNRMILEDYRRNRDAFVKLGDIVHDKLSEMIRGAGIQIMAIEHRVKTEKSLAGKLERNGDYYQSFDELTDILGARVICFFADEVDIIGKMVEQTFEIDWNLSSDKRKLLEADSFGYLSLHYICSLAPGKGYPDEVCNKPFEIQIRTNLQHTWAQIEHDLGYKSEFGVPRTVVRNFSRIAGLLELADSEFMRARDLMVSYTEEIRQKIIHNCANDVRIDMISLAEYVNRNEQMQAFLKELSAVAGAEISPESPDNYIEQLAWFGIKTLGGVQQMMEQCRELALSMANAALSQADLDILSSNVGLRYLCRAKLLLDGYDEEKIAEFLKISMGDETRAARQAKYLLRTAAARKVQKA